MATFYVGEQPSVPLVVTVRNPDGSPRLLTDVSSVSFVGDSLPAGVAVVNNAVQGKVQYTFSAPFAESAKLTLQVRMVDNDGGVDYSDPFTITVSDSTHPGTYTLLTPTDAEEITGTPVTRQNVLQAQAFVALLVDRDLSDATVIATIRARDLTLLRQAIAWQSVTEGQPAMQVALPPGVTSVGLGDISLGFGKAQSATAGLAPLAQLAVSRLSWMGMRSIHLRTTRQRQPFSPLVSDRHPWTA